jgi:hypothetical protein
LPKYGTSGDRHTIVSAETVALIDMSQMPRN